MPYLTAILVVSSLAAFGVHCWWFRERWLMRDAQRAAGHNGDLESLATLFVHGEFWRMLVNAVVLLIAVGIALGRPAVWVLLQVVPVASIMGSVQFLRSRHI